MPSTVEVDIDRVRATLLPAHVGYLIPVGFLLSSSVAAWALGLVAWWACGPLSLLGVGVVAASRTAVWQLDCTGEALVLERRVLGRRVERTAWKMEEIQAFASQGEALTITFVGRPAWTLHTRGTPPHELSALVGLLEEARRSSAAFWRDELTAGRRRERTGVDRLRERGE